MGSIQDYFYPNLFLFTRQFDFMSGHSKWSTIKRAKAVTDGRRSKVWARVTRDIMTAAREGGGDVGMNPRLATAVDKAKSENMPKDNITRAIKRGTGEIEGADYVESTYEGYGPHGIAIYVEGLTDNTNRTVADVRHLFGKYGAGLGLNGSVAFQFVRKGIFTIASAGNDEMTVFELVADAGAEDLTQDGDDYSVTCPVESFGTVTSALEGAGISIKESELQRIPTTTTRLELDEAKAVMKLIELLEDHQEVQAVYSTLEIDDAMIEAMA
jgi:YebC/PmpR family DNA-binding regulatory protein